MKTIEHSFLNFFDEDIAQSIAADAKSIQLQDQEILFSEGDEPDYLYLVLDGSIEILKSDTSGQPKSIAFIHANDFVGEFAILDGGPRSATARAAGTTSLVGISKDVILQHLSQSNAGLDLTLKIISRMRQSNQIRVEEMMRQEKMSIVGRMINGIMHDFRNPFAVILMLSDLIAQQHPDMGEFCNTIGEQIDRLTGMAEDLLEFSKGGSALSKAPFELSDMIERFKRLNQKYLASLNIELTTDSDSGTVHGDEEKLLRVLQNLMSNAAQALESNGGCIQIKAKFKDDRMLQLAVADDGPGIPEQVRHNLFEAFSTYGKKKGLGLGMAITQSIIQGHGGTIRFETETGKGTTFFIELPAINDSAS
jgi:signal transduction histidine kinase